MSFFGVLGLIFITLKLLAFIDWSWWLVLLPLYGGLLIFVALSLVVICTSWKASFGAA